MKKLGASAQSLIFTVALTCLSRFFLLWDWIHGYRRSDWKQATPGVACSRIAIQSGPNALDAVFAQPDSQPTVLALLICHGIGETIEYWFGVQRLLAVHGIASLVFDYSGYGRSSGVISFVQCERDAIAAFEQLRQLAPSLPVSILGFSLGSGIAAAVVPSVPAHCLVLCAVFTSFKAAALSIGFPRRLSFMSLDIWRTEESLRSCRVPVLIVHGERDELFPIEMALALQSSCHQGKLVIVPRLSHNEPHVRPERSYWIETIGRFLRESHYFASDSPS
jgi:pimeloyl-ACP methyl ester carboxylesterase